VPDPAWTEVFTDENVTIYRNYTLYGRAYFVRQVRVEPDARATLAALRTPGFEPQEVADVEGGMSDGLARALSQGDADAPGSASARVARLSPNELRIETQTARDRFLVLSEMWSPGWHAEIDGRDTTIYRADYLFRGLVVPAGRHTVRVYYRPGAVLLGGALTATMLLGLVAALAVAWRRPKVSSPARLAGAASSC
jgi:hypothetical protein